MAKAVRELTRRLKRNGWTVDGRRRGNHVRLYPPDGGRFIVCSLTPSNAAWKQSVEADIKRAGYGDDLKGGR